MPLQKESITFSFTKGIDTFVDPNQLPIGKFTYLQNVTFVETGGTSTLNKRNGYQNVVALDSQSSFITRYSEGLVSISPNFFKSYTNTVGQWITYPISPLKLSVNTVIRNAYNQTALDMAISPNGLVCTAYLESRSFGSGSFISGNQVFAVTDINTGRILVGPTQITSTIGTVSQTSMPKVFSIGSQFAIFSGIPNANISSGSLYGAIQYFTVNQNTLAVSSANIFTTSYSTQTTGSTSITSGFDGVVASNSLYFSWYAGSASGKSGIMATSFNNSLVQGAVASITQSGGAVTCLSLASDNVGPSPSRLWYTFICGTQNDLRTAVSDFSFGTISSGGMQLVFSSKYNNVTTFALNGTMTFFIGITATFLNDPAAAVRRNDYIEKGSVGLNLTDVMAANQVKLPGYNVAPASKPVLIGSDSYWLMSFNSIYQSTYFLMNSASSVISKVAYGNGGGTYLADVPQLQSIGSSLFVGYLYKTQITNVNKLTAAGSQTQTAGVYAQTGINVAKFNFTTLNINTIETANNLHINGGQTLHYDGQILDEMSFNSYPDFIDFLVGSTSGGLMAAQTYYYVAVYEYTDNKGNIFRSAPSIPQAVTVSSGANCVFLYVPTYTVTLKPASSVRTSFYRWSQTQQIYYQVTSPSDPLTNTDQRNANIQSLNYTDIKSDAQILGNNILYTNGGVVEDDAPPAATAMTMFDDRMWLIDAEDQNLLWLSKTIIEGGVPVEFSGLLTYFVPPTTATGAPTGVVTAFAPMDDKLILFKNQTIYYINGTGPDSTGANSQYSFSPIFVTSGVGCINQNSIVLTPMGLIFQSNTKGIWLLKRDLSIDFVGKEVELYNSANILSACLIATANEVRFTLDNGITLLYDYLVGEWCVNTTNGKSACLYQGLHTYLTNTGSIFQETPGQYLDGTVPVVMKWTSGFINPTLIQGYQRVYWANILGNFFTGNTYTLGIGYDYDTAIVQTATVIPTNTIGSGSQVEPWQINFARTQCQSFQLTFTEISSGTAGAGLTLSNFNLVIGRKKTYPRNIKPTNRTG